MEIIGNRKYVNVPGGKTHELPPLLLKERTVPAPLEQIVALAGQMVETESLVSEIRRDPHESDSSLQQRKFNLAINFAEHYLQFLRHWDWGESIVEWIRQCETTFETKAALRPLIHADVWPYVNHSRRYNQKLWMSG